MTTFGVHTGVQNTTVDELRSLWTGAEELGFAAAAVRSLLRHDAATHVGHHVRLVDAQQATDALGRYVAAGVDTVNVALRAPWNPGALDRAAAAVAALR